MLICVAHINQLLERTALSHLVCIIKSVITVYKYTSQPVIHACAQRNTPVQLITGAMGFYIYVLFVMSEYLRYLIWQYIHCMTHPNISKSINQTVHIVITSNKIVPSELWQYRMHIMPRLAADVSLLKSETQTT